MHPQSAIMHFSLVLKQQVGRVPLRAELVFILWSEEVAAQHRVPDCCSLTKPLVCDTQSGGVCLGVIVDVELQM